MNGEINLNDLSKIGINENLLTHCFAKKGISINYDNLDWVQKNLQNSSIIETKSTTQEFSEPTKNIRQSFVLIEDKNLTEAISITNFEDDDSLETLIDSLAKLQKKDIINSQRIIFEYSEKLFNKKHFLEIRSFQKTIKSWMDWYQSVSPSFYLYIELHFAYFLFQLERSKNHYINFHLLKSNIMSNNQPTENTKIDIHSIVSYERLLKSLDFLDQDLSTFIQSNSDYNERFSFCDFSNFSHFKELHLSEVVKVNQVYYGDSHILWDCSFENRNYIFGLGDNSSGQLMPESEFKFFNRPILLKRFEEFSAAKLGAHLNNSFYATSSTFCVWGKNFGNRFLNIDIAFKKEIMSIHLLGTQLIYGNNENQIFLYNFEQHLNNKQIPTNIKQTELGQIDDQIRQISVGVNHLLVLTVTGSLFAYGNNEHYQINENKNKPFFDKLTKIDSPAIDKIISIFCHSNFTLVIDCKSNCYIFGKVSTRKEIRYPESFELYPETTNFDLKKQGIFENSLRISGNEKKLMIFTRFEIFEWSTEQALKFKMRSLEDKKDIKLFHLGRTYEFSEKQGVFGHNCEFSVKSEKIRKSECLKCKIILRDSENKPFKSVFQRELIGIYMIKNSEIMIKKESKKSNFNTFMFKNHNIELRNYGKTELSTDHINRISENEFEFDLKCHQVGLYVLQLFCNGKKMKNEFIIEVLDSNDNKPKEDFERKAFNTFLTNSSVQNSIIGEDNMHVTAEKHNKLKLKPIQTENKSIFTYKPKKNLVRFSSIKKTKPENEGKLILDEKFGGKYNAKLPPLPDSSLNLKSEKFVFKKK